MHLEVPFFSQLDTEVPQELQRSVCAIACIKMILDYKNESCDFASILREAQWIGEMDKAGWTHEVLVRVLRNHNVLAYRQEFVGHTVDMINLNASIAEHSQNFIEEGIKKIKRGIDNQNPVMVSVRAGFSKNEADHVVLITGYDDESFYILDPIIEDNQNPLAIPLQTFIENWKKLAIFVE